MDRRYIYVLEKRVRGRKLWRMYSINVNEKNYPKRDWTDDNGNSYRVVKYVPSERR